jgi:hypothetical protein
MYQQKFMTYGIIAILGSSLFLSRLNEPMLSFLHLLIQLPFLVMQSSSSSSSFIPQCTADLLIPTEKAGA